MSLLEKDRIAQEQKQKDDAVRIYEEQVKIGKSAERLLNNLDWQRVSTNILNAVRARKLEAEEMVRSMIQTSTDTTADGDHKLCNTLRKAFQEIDDWEYLLNLPKREVEVGEEASKQLAKLREGNSNG